MESHKHSHHGKPAALPEGAARDPVCGMTVDPKRAKHRTLYEGHPYYFCSPGCLTKFEADPARYLEKEPLPAPAVPEGTIYTCPMHPEIRQPGPAHALFAAWLWNPFWRRRARRKTPNL